ncbi:hypothetical protein [Pararhodobacter sp.]|uniref:WD40 repeat domain-containing protein n=1 Tax=Pararhodobacter sp. TaxID=2127056 RepID=UPI002AFE4C30|nr:hypothetical protein [Pararhodobacter sp.]
MGHHRIAGSFFLAHVIAAGALVPGETQAQTQPQWHLVGQLELSPGEVIGPLTVSPLGELVAGTAWNPAARFAGRVWSTRDGLQIADLDQPFQALLEINFAQAPYDPNTLQSSVYAHSRRELRSWLIADGTLTGGFEFDADMLATDALLVPYREAFFVSQEFGDLPIYSTDGEVIGAVEVDAMRPHAGLRLSEDGTLLVVDSGAFTLSTLTANLTAPCPAPGCSEDPVQLPGSYGPYEKLLAFDARNARLATLPEVNPERAGFQDGPFRAVAEPTIRIWSDIETWTSTTAPDLEITGFVSDVTWAQFSADGTRLLTLEDAGHLAVWDTESGRQVFRLVAVEDARVVAAHLIPNSKSLFVHWSSGVSQIVGLGQGAVEQEFPQPNADVVVSPDGQTLITYAIGEAPARVWRRR